MSKSIVHGLTVKNQEAFCATCDAWTSEWCALPGCSLLLPLRVTCPKCNKKTMTFDWKDFRPRDVRGPLDTHTPVPPAAAAAAAAAAAERSDDAGDKNRNSNSNKRKTAYDADELSAIATAARMDLLDAAEEEIATVQIKAAQMGALEFCLLKWYFETRKIHVETLQLLKERGFLVQEKISNAYNPETRRAHVEWVCTPDPSFRKAKLAHVPSSSSSSSSARVDLTGDSKMKLKQKGEDKDADEEEDDDNSSDATLPPPPAYSPAQDAVIDSLVYFRPSAPAAAAAAASH